jgi:hypothetical protein
MDFEPDEALTDPDFEADITGPQASRAERYRDAQERGEPFVEMQPTEKPEDLKAKIDAEIAAIRLEDRLKRYAHIPGVNLDSDDEQAHAGNFVPCW